MAQYVGAPSVGASTDQSNNWELAHRVEDFLHQKALHKEPRCIDADLVLVAPANRDGAPPNVQYIHQGLLKGFKDKGFDRTRPQAGICVEYTSPEGKQSLIEHNQRFSRGAR